MSLMMVSIAVKDHNERMMSALLYDDVTIFESWESDTHVAVIWSRENDFLVTYQRERLLSGWIPTYDLWNGGMDQLVDKMGLNVPCYRA